MWARINNNDKDDEKNVGEVGGCVNKREGQSVRR